MPRSRQAGNFSHYQSKQRGAALMIMLVIMVLGAAAFLVSSLSKPGLKIERAKIISSDALLQTAKEALIAYAISNDVRLGNLPCPDRDAPGDIGYGDAEGSCSAGGSTSIGRLPWKTLGIPELVDAAGEPLWYALSDNFRGIVSVINSDTQGTLSVYDADGTTLLTPAGSEAVAIIFSPGAIVGSQQRGTTAEKKNPSNYLETGPNSRNNANAAGPFIAANESNTFNDRLLYITADQLLPPVEKRAGNELKNLLKAYYTAWGAFPFAAPFINPSPPAAFDGVTGTYNGLPPIGNINLVGTTITPVWNAIPTATLNGASCDAGTTPSCTCSLRTSTTFPSTTSCTSNCPIWRCNISGITGTPTIRITGALNNIGFGMWRLYDPSASSNGSPEVGVRISPSSTYRIATTVMDNVSVSGSLDASGNATVTFSGTVQAGNIPTRIQLYPNVIPSYSLPSWFGMNNWHQVMYYATSPGYAPGGGNACNPLPGTPPCLTVNSSGGVNTNKPAVVVMTGKALASQAPHHSSTLSNYLEGENKTPTDYIYENKTRSSIFNDQVIIVTP